MGSKRIRNIWSRIFGKNKKDPILEDMFLEKDNFSKISLLETLLNRETFYWCNVPKYELIKYTDVDFAKLVIDNRNVRELFLNYPLDKKVCIFCHLYNYICYSRNDAKKIINVVSLFYDIKYQYDTKRQEFALINDLKVVDTIKSKHSIVVTALQNEPSLQNVMKYYYQNDIGKALAELRKITEFSDEKNKKFQNFILSQGEDLQEMCIKVYKFITTYENHIAENAGASDTEARIWLDLGLSIYRLYLMNSK